MNIQRQSLLVGFIILYRILLIDILRNFEFYFPSLNYDKNKNLNYSNSEKSISNSIMDSATLEQVNKMKKELNPNKKLKLKKENFNPPAPPPKKKKSNDIESDLIDDEEDEMRKTKTAKLATSVIQYRRTKVDNENETNYNKNNNIVKLSRKKNKDDDDDDDDLKSKKSNFKKKNKKKNDDYEDENDNYDDFEEEEELPKKKKKKKKKKKNKNEEEDYEDYNDDYDDYDDYEDYENNQFKTIPYDKKYKKGNDYYDYNQEYYPQKIANPNSNFYQNYYNPYIRPTKKKSSVRFLPNEIDDNNDYYTYNNMLKPKKSSLKNNDYYYQSNKLTNNRKLSYSYKNLMPNSNYKSNVYLPNYGNRLGNIYLYKYLWMNDDEIYGKIKQNRELEENNNKKYYKSYEEYELIKKKIIHNFNIIINILHYIFKKAFEENVPIYNDDFKERFALHLLVHKTQNESYNLKSDEIELINGILVESEEVNIFIKDNQRWLQLYKYAAYQFSSDFARKCLEN